MSSEADPLVQYVALRRDLWKEEKWPLGSIIAQGCHAATAALWISRDTVETREYCAAENLDHMRKVVLEVQDAKQLLALASRLEEDGILFKAWIEQPENIPTAIACSPNKKSILNPYFKSLKLCRG